MQLTTHNLRAGYDRATDVLRDVSLTVPDGSFTGILGPNGSGKSTLLKVIARLLRPAAGDVALDQRDLLATSRRELARHMAILPQQPSGPADLTVRQLLGYGRYPYLGRFSRFSDDDRAIIDNVIEQCELSELADRPLGQLSGGERQRAWVGMALAQQPRVLLLDEPLSHLDINHQLEVMELLVALNREQGLTVAIVLHDINLAVRFCDRLAVIEAGRLVAEGPTAEILSDDVIDRTFGVNKQVMSSPDSDAAVCYFQRAAASPHQ